MANIKRNEEVVYQAVLDGELEIDSEGRVWRHIARRWNRWDKKTVPIACKRRRAEHDTGQYLQVRVMHQGKRFNALAHRLVYHHFLGPIPEGLTINHQNGKKKDNRPGNLELATHSEQAKHALNVLKVGRTNQWGQYNAMAKLTTEDVAAIRQRRASGEGLASIAADYPVTFQTVSKIARGDRRSHG